METVHDAYRHMLKEELTPRLKTLGFITDATEPPDPPTPRTTDFHLETPDHYALLGPHEYWANTCANFQFTINILVISHPQWQTFRTTTQDFDGNPWPEEPDTSTHYGPQGPWTQRLGHLMGSGDKWWYISPRRPTEPIADDITTAIRDYALPAINQHLHHPNNPPTNP